VHHLEAEFREQGAPGKEGVGITLQQEVNAAMELGQGVMSGPIEARKRAQ